MPAVSVIIVSYKVRYYIEQCLNSVLRSVPDAQIFVVDNDSADGSVEYLRERFPQIEVIANDFNAGFGKANNMALAKAKGRYVPKEWGSSNRAWVSVRYCFMVSVIQSGYH